MSAGWRFTLPMWTGIRLVPWLSLLARHKFRVAPSRIHRAIGITAAALGNEVLAGIQWAVWGRGLRAARIEHDPIVILGHWRSGTTLLHELLACDPAFVAPTTVQCGVPSHFVLSEQFARERLGFLLPKRRPMDNMTMGFDRPQEDELALCNLGLPSPWWTVAFPNDPPPDPAYETLESLSPHDRDRWIATWLGFLRAIQFEHHGRLVLKNPLHTYRVPLIRGVFPETDFIHIVRDPREMVPSCLHFWRSIAEDHGLQRPQAADLEDRVFASLVRMDRRLHETWETIPERRRHRLRYEDLAADPSGVLRGVYDHFGWPVVEGAQGRWQARLNEQPEYRRNQFSVDHCLSQRIDQELADVLIRSGYDAAPRHPR